MISAAEEEMPLYFLHANIMTMENSALILQYRCAY